MYDNFKSGLKKCVCTCFQIRLYIKSCYIPKYVGRWRIAKKNSGLVNIVIHHSGPFFNFNLGGVRHVFSLVFLLSELYTTAFSHVPSTMWTKLISKWANFTIVSLIASSRVKSTFWQIKSNLFLVYFKHKTCRCRSQICSPCHIEREREAQKLL